MLLFNALHHRKQYSSYTSGFAFGKHCFPFFPDGSIETIKRTTDSLRLNPNYVDMFFYRYGFLRGFVEEYKRVRHCSHPLENFVYESEDFAMGKLNDLITATNDQPLSSGFIKPGKLVGKSFCITMLNHTTGKYGPQWNMRIVMHSKDVPAEVVEKYDVDTSQPSVILTCSMLDEGKSRDRAFVSMMSKPGEYPYHCGTFKSIPLDNGNAYLSLVESEDGVCPCGHVEIPSEELDLGDLGDHPF